MVYNMINRFLSRLFLLITVFILCTFCCLSAPACADDERSVTAAMEATASTAVTTDAASTATGADSVSSAASAAAATTDAAPASSTESTASATAPSAPEPAVKARYLQAGLYSSVSDYTHAAELIEEAENRIDYEPAAEEYHDFVYNVQPENAFSFLLQIAEKRGLVQAGTFLQSSDVAEQYRFITETNEFPAFSADKFTLTGGTSFEITSGDLLFWLDESGEPVNVGLVCSIHKSYCLAVVDDPEKGTAILCLSANTIKDLSNFMLVRPVYSSIEQQIYFYCRNEMGYTRAGACGLLANIAYESGFHYAREEIDLKMGVGICQWSYERRDDLNEYCEQNALDPLTLEAQLKFMQFELENRYAFTGDFLKTVPDDTTGAYDAGYWVCFEYEQPVDFEFVSDDRACLSRDSYWPIYGAAIL